MTTTKLVKQLEFKRDGIGYTIYVESDGEAMWGTWNCKDCGIGGSTHTKCDTITSAIHAAQVDLDIHHTANH